MTGRIIRTGPWPVPAHPCGPPEPKRSWWFGDQHEYANGTRWQCDDCGDTWTWGYGHDMEQWHRDTRWSSLPTPPTGPAGTTGPTR